MTDTHPATALLLFIRDPAEEARQKWLVSGGSSRRNLLAIKLLNRRVRRVARQTGLPTFVISGHRQRGSTFGERFSHAIGDVLARGFERVIALGNDCLDLDRAAILEAADRLCQAGLVIGPDLRGGAYLIGLRADHWHASRFADLPWQQAHLLQALLDYGMRSRASVSLLDLRRDVHCAPDLANVLQRVYAPSRTYRLLAQLLTDRIRKIPGGQNLAAPIHGLFLSPFNRPPPGLPAY